jgi:hypothetical protein
MFEWPVASFIHNGLKRLPSDCKDFQPWQDRPRIKFSNEAHHHPVPIVKECSRHQRKKKLEQCPAIILSAIDKEKKTSQASKCDKNIIEGEILEDRNVHAQARHFVRVNLRGLNLRKLHIYSKEKEKIQRQR